VAQHRSSGAVVTV